ncbi:TIGR03773 family transporter-associated surface protein [Jiangella gansuensis]|uniref:TIGR03773 family transporter-associated surface protein n=1 Tax=Jiangella gansuensis TaxID=281473 RepID=UPI0004AE447C|nr:TIGR03773 family transporter-associated surface protein [Jiangella gansuensis]
MRRSMLQAAAAGAGVAALLSAPVVAGLSASADPGLPPAPTERRLLTTEHVDAINVGFDGDRLTVNSKIGPPAEYAAVDDLIFHLSDLGRVEGLPAHYTEFIGTSDVWLVPQTQDPDVLWAGWSTEEIGSGVVDGDAVDVTLTDVRGPGEVEVWQTVGFGEISRIFSSDEDFSTRRQGVNAHVHANWAFTQPGVYTLSFTASATVGGQPVTSDPVDYTWVVGGEQGTLPTPATSMTTLTAPATAAVGQETVLEVDVSTDTGDGAPPAPGGHVEFRRGDALLGWTGLTDGRATLPVTFDEPGEHTITATYTPQERQFYATSASQPVVVTVEGAEPGTEAGGDDQGTETGGENPDDPPGQCEDPRTVLTDEHVDLLAPVLDGSAFGLRAKVGTATDHTFYDPADLLVQVKDPEAATAVPDGPEYAFLGEAGEPLWLIPQAQDPNVVWAGWSTEELAPGAFAGDAVEFALVGVEGPGDVEVFQTGSLGSAPTRIFSSVDQLEPRSQSVGQHVHANWAFTELGEYTATFEVSGTLTGGQSVTTGEVAYTFVVGDLACDPGSPGDENGTDAGGDANGTDTGGDANGTDTGGDGNGTDTGGDANGTDTGGDANGTDTGGDANGTDTGGDANGTDSGDDANGTDTGGDANGADDGGDGNGTASGGDGAGPKPTTKPTSDVCVPARPTSAPSGSSTTPNGGGTQAPDGGGGDQPSDSVVLTNEHVDLISPRLEGSSLFLEAKVGTAAEHTFYDPANVLVQVKPEAQSTVPEGETYAFLGAAGDPIWLIGETQNPDVVWAGWSTEQLAAGSFQADAVDMTLVDVEGPGVVEVFQSAGFGDVNRIFSSEEALDPRHQSVGQHVHANWAFTAEGSYTLTFEVSGTLADGQSVTTGPVEYSFVVGDVAGAQGASATRSADGVVRPAVYVPAADGVVVRASATPTPSATPSSTPRATPSSSNTGQDDECALASTGSPSALPALAVMGGLLVVSGAVASASYWRSRRSTP